MKGKIVLLPFPFTDLRASKYRPALVLHEGKRDVVVAFISSRLPSSPSRGDIIIKNEHAEFSQTGLKVSSVVKLNKIATILKDMIIGELGSLGPSLRREVNKRMRELYSL
jgi:mRNA interferase MazF